MRFYVITNRRKELLPADLPFEEMRESVRAIPDSDAYVQLERTEVLGSAYDLEGSARGRRAVPVIALDRIERDVRLRVERHRNYRPLILGDDEALAEPTFYSIFPRNVLGVMRNSGQSPTHASFRDYVNKLELLSEPIEVLPLADQDAFRALGEVGTLTRMNVAVGPEVSADVFEASPYIRDSIRLAREQLGYVTVEIQVKIKPSGHDAEAEATLTELRGLLESGAIARTERAEMAYRSILNGRARSYDFIDEAVVTQATVTLDPDTSKPTEPSAAEAMALAFDSVYDDIYSALDALQ
ncbi:hypothetical protein [Cellulosimicrobium cellulans]|uniref:hypothetical protein n=1 Tax=Cellulosimicrobium cellulans TaxID=1710 RepID=UPI00188440CD|nr:hypothetical protein [Cellulosimicrobium cellulans]MBE9938918.1 hypothetical protein [Cellulosimicrobium cellulans]